MPRNSQTIDQFQLFPSRKTPFERGLLLEAPTSDWDFTGNDTQYLTHGLHPYLASMIPQIPKRLLALYADSSTKVLDPFVGGGAVLVESYLANVSAVGVDVNPLAVILSKAKTAPIPERVLLEVGKNFEKTFAKITSVTLDFPSSSRIDFWFKPYTLEPLGRIRLTIEKVSNKVSERYRSKVKNLLSCVFSDTVRDVSLTYRGEVRLRRLQGKDFDRFNPNVEAAFRKRMEQAFYQINQLPRHKHVPKVYRGDARKLKALDREFDLVITSPPYGDIKNTIPYHQFSKNMLFWLGFDESVIDQIQDDSLGARDGKKKPPPSQTLQVVLTRMTKSNLIHEAVCFYCDYFDALKEITRVTSKRIVIVIGHRILDGVVIDNASITTDMMQEIGWQLETTYARSIRKKRIHKSMGFGHNAQGGTIDRESILVYVPK